MSIHYRAWDKEPKVSNVQQSKDDRPCLKCLDADKCALREGGRIIAVLACNCPLHEA